MNKMLFFKNRIILLLLISFITFFPLIANGVERNTDVLDKFANQKLLFSLFEKLEALEKGNKGKINIVHIGDSHIQADIFTNAIRGALQSKFGDGGFGFTFPYNFLRTNGTRGVKYTSNAVWQSLLNIYPVADVGVGLSGIALYTASPDFILQLSTEGLCEFNTVKIIYPSQEAHYKMSVAVNPLSLLSPATSSSYSSILPATKSHKVKKGETLSLIAKRYGVTLAQIKKANKMKSDKISIGKNLQIPTKGKNTSKTKKVPANTTKSRLALADDTEFVRLVSKPYYSSYTSDAPLNRITILPDGVTGFSNLNGFVLENNNPGIIYHSIGVNGSKLSDYNKYPLFFKQLPILSPDLIILSFGTNESFGKMAVWDYVYQLKQFIANIVKQCGKDVVVLVMTPPPSLFRGKKPNSFVTDYSIELMGMNSFPVWDLYSRMGGLSGIEAKGEYASLIARDNVHYTHKGYQTQGDMFSDDFIDAYNNFKKNKKN